MARQRARRNCLTMTRRALPKFESYETLETATVWRRRGKSAIEWFYGIARLVPVVKVEIARKIRISGDFLSIKRHVRIGSHISMNRSNSPISSAG
jgi:hypothetical protein